MSSKIKKQKVVPLILDTYLLVIKNSIGSKLFRNLYAKVNGQKTDITKNGNLSCAFYVSSILFLFKLIKEIHATVNGTARDLKESGWSEIKKPKVGCVLIWTETDFGNNSLHKHIGFYVGNRKAISNDYKKGYPTEHDFKFRKIESILWHTNLN
jgi:uncharacterized protein YycO